MYVSITLMHWLYHLTCLSISGSGSLCFSGHQKASEVLGSKIDLVHPKIDHGRELNNNIDYSIPHTFLSICCIYTYYIHTYIHTYIYIDLLYVYHIRNDMTISLTLVSLVCASVRKASDIGAEVNHLCPVKRYSELLQLLPILSSS